jgi:hypothetical protein
MGDGVSFRGETIVERTDEELAELEERARAYST